VWCGSLDLGDIHHRLSFREPAAKLTRPTTSAPKASRIRTCGDAAQIGFGKLGYAGSINSDAPRRASDHLLLDERDNGREVLPTRSNGVVTGHPCANCKTTQKKSGFSTKNHRSNMPPGSAFTYGLINRVWEKIVPLNFKPFQDGRPTLRKKQGTMLQLRSRDFLKFTEKKGPDFL
jgi:hypothetical protein